MVQGTRSHGLGTFDGRGEPKVRDWSALPPLQAWAPQAAVASMNRCLTSALRHQHVAHANAARV